MAKGEIAAILEKIAETTRSNYEKIDTWKGEYLVVTERLDAQKRHLQSEEAKWDGRPYLTLIEAKLTFAIVPRKESWQLNYDQTKPPSFKTLNGKNIPFKSGRFVQQTILTPERYCSFRPRQMYSELEGFDKSLGDGQLRSRVVFEKHRTDMDATSRTTGPLVDPLLFYGNGSLQTWRRCSRYAQAIRENKFNAEQLSRIRLQREATERGMKYTFQVQYDADTPNASEAMTSHDVYLETQGFNLVQRYKERAGKRYEQWDFQFGRKDGIYYPEIVDVVKTSLGDGAKTLSSQYRILNCSFDEPIPDEQFTINAFGLENGERVASEIAGTVRAFKDESLIPLEEYNYGSDETDAP